MRIAEPTRIRGDVRETSRARANATTRRRNDSPTIAYVKELTLRSLGRLIKQLKEEKIWYECHAGIRKPSSPCCRIDAEHRRNVFTVYELSRTESVVSEAAVLVGVFLPDREAPARRWRNWKGLPTRPACGSSAD